MVNLHLSSFILLTIPVACPCVAQFVLTPRNTDGLYQVGENAVWIVKPAADSQATPVIYSAHKNGTDQILQQGTLNLSSGGATIEAGLGEPGEVALELAPPPTGQIIRQVRQTL
jgi:hypothetical protein